MDIEKLKEINQQWEYYGKPQGLNKQANELFKFLSNALSNTYVAGKDIAKTLMFATPLIAGLGALGYNKITSPKALAKNVDKELLKATLDKEIAVWERYIADERERLNNTNKDKKYDRFI